MALDGEDAGRQVKRRRWRSVGDAPLATTQDKVLAADR